jgi:type VI secretion system secreted protein Hcp
MAFDAFIKIDGIPGECTDDKHKDWIEITSFDWSLAQPASATASNAGGSTAERVNIAPIQFTHLFDKASPKLYEACCKGTHIKDATIHLNRAGGDKMLYGEITLTQVLVSSVGVSGSHGGDFPSESVTLSGASYVWKYNQQDKASGQAAGTISAGWDLALNKPKA